MEGKQINTPVNQIDQYKVNMQQSNSSKSLNNLTQNNKIKSTVVNPDKKKKNKTLIGIILGIICILIVFLLYKNTKTEQIVQPVLQDQSNQQQVQEVQEVQKIYNKQQLLEQEILKLQQQPTEDPNIINSKINDLQMQLTDLTNYSELLQSQLQNQINTTSTTNIKNTQPAIYVTHPVGSILIWPAMQLPQDYLVCNGDTFNELIYPELFKVLSVNILPDLQGQFVRGLDLNGHNDPDGPNRIIGSLQSGMFTRHMHQPVILPSGGGTYILTGNTSSNTIPLYTTGNGFSGSDTGRLYRAESSGGTFQYGSHKHTFTGYLKIPQHEHDLQILEAGGVETRPTNVSMLYIIKAK